MGDGAVVRWVFVELRRYIVDGSLGSGGYFTRNLSSNDEPDGLSWVLGWDVLWANCWFCTFWLLRELSPNDEPDGLSWVLSLCIDWTGFISRYLGMSVVPTSLDTGYPPFCFCWHVVSLPLALCPLCRLWTPGSILIYWLANCWQITGCRLVRNSLSGPGIGNHHDRTHIPLYVNEWQRFDSACGRLLDARWLAGIRQSTWLQYGSPFAPRLRPGLVLYEFWTSSALLLHLLLP